MWTDHTYYNKYRSLVDAGSIVAPLPPPEPPHAGWITLAPGVTPSIQLPPVTSGRANCMCFQTYSNFALLMHLGLLYAYLAGHVGSHTGSEGAFYTLKRGYVHWASGRVQKIEVNANNPLRKGTYKVYLLLSKEKGCSVEKATCECAAG